MLGSFGKGSTIVIFMVPPHWQGVVASVFDGLILQSPATALAPAV
jgi:hypothetical protein